MHEGWEEGRVALTGRKAGNMDAAAARVYTPPHKKTSFFRKQEKKCFFRKQELVFLKNRNKKDLYRAHRLIVGV